MEELIRQYNAACERVNNAVTALRANPNDEAAEAEFRTAQAEAQRCRENLDRAEELDGVAARFTPVPVPAQANPNELGMDAREVRSYSLLRAIRAAASGDWRGAELEREASEAIAERMGRDPQGFFVPLDVQREQRDMTVGTDADGGYLVANDLRAGSMIDMLRNRMVTTQAGATFLSGLVGDIAIPRQTGGATGYWLAESGAPTESKQAIDQVALTPKTYGAFTDISRKLLKQSSIDVENFVRADLAATIALGLDLAALHGTGQNNQPTGLAATSGIGSVVGGDNGAAPTWSHIVKLETEVAIDNADIGTLAYLTNAKVRGKLKETPKVSSTDSVMVWADGATPLNGYRTLVSNQVSSTLTKGSANGTASAIFFGNWADLFIGQWGTLDLLVDPFTGSTSGTLRIVALQDIDIAVRHAQSFAAMLDALPA